MSTRSRAIVCFTIAIVVAILISTVGERAFGFSETLSYIVLGISVPVVYEAMTLLLLRIR